MIDTQTYRRRLGQISCAVVRYGHYRMESSELEHACRVAWRQDPRLIAPAIAAIFGVRPADSVQALAGLLGGGRFLLVIDTFERNPTFCASGYSWPEYPHLIPRQHDRPR